MPILFAVLTLAHHAAKLRSPPFPPIAGLAIDAAKELEAVTFCAYPNGCDSDNAATHAEITNSSAGRTEVDASSASVQWLPQGQGAVRLKPPTDLIWSPR